MVGARPGSEPSPSKQITPAAQSLHDAPSILTTQTLNHGRQPWTGCSPDEQITPAAQPLHAAPPTITAQTSVQLGRDVVTQYCWAAPLLLECTAACLNSSLAVLLSLQCYSRNTITSRTVESPTVVAARSGAPLPPCYLARGSGAGAGMCLQGGRGAPCCFPSELAAVTEALSACT